MKKIKFIGILIFSLFVSIVSCDKTDDREGGVVEKPLVIAHRGAQSVFPEHTLEAYAKGIELGADFIEPDLVMTKDGVLIARHEPFMSGTTNVADLLEFANLKTTKNLDGKEITDWFASDFTLAQIKRLRAKQPRSDRSNQFDGLYQIPTLKEIIALTKLKTGAQGKVVGIYPEMKHPYFHNKLGLAIEDALLEVLDSEKMNSYDAPVFVQCFEVAPLQYINSKSTVKLVQLISTYNVNNDGTLDYNVPTGDFISYASPFDFYVNGDNRTYEYFTTEEGMRFTSTYADGIGPWKPFIISFSKDANNNITVLPATNFVDLAHKYDLKVHPYTFRNEDEKWSKGNSEAEYHLFFDAGVDGIFTDYTDAAVKAVSTWKPK
ncbi:glycerophosphodiester phosphodiesterase [Flavivirga aquatica]|uniref:glycerophosphodiester phosphodiesterase n=1 Tax=Flavivirga aquatica TaxID=1849968 RepID=A0A1E5SIH5_9FLAO|nr:glycerophosphodiester phosphodiesterase [Flavivirga aquatica]OEJ98910.1 glycerophosphodiester phosphodiesterase [Flavivirga aquatica]